MPMLVYALVRLLSGIPFFGVAPNHLARSSASCDNPPFWRQDPPNRRITLEGMRNDVLVSDASAHLATALAGLGLVHTLDFMVRSSVEQGVLVPVLARWRPDPIEVYAAYPPSRRYSTKVRVFVDWVTTLFGSR